MQLKITQKLGKIIFKNKAIFNLKILPKLLINNIGMTIQYILIINTHYHNHYPVISID